MDELKNILRAALSTVEEITLTNTPKRTETSPITGPNRLRSYCHNIAIDW